eukprot:CAMPEP_0173278828 /NCGR_PEP_ID=MMETSP1143-20121109/4828_1 /TAXON_ID=483371 /ORGANISM="non described non described, Strain CCMP2298" /LENGTH=113 /DNA_ID=CAMNT_0014216025 /DNA_START=1351 /DNA_END=1688 /DNA_ORIENTATION=-
MTDLRLGRAPPGASSGIILAPSSPSMLKFTIDARIAPRITSLPSPPCTASLGQHGEYFELWQGGGLVEVQEAFGDGVVVAHYPGETGMQVRRSGHRVDYIPRVVPDAELGAHV